MTTKRKISDTKDLHAAISELERKVQVQEMDLKVNYNQTKESLQPTRMMKNTFTRLAETPEIQRTLVNTFVGFIVGFASKKAVEALSEKTLNHTVSNIVGHHLAKLEDTQPGGLISTAVGLIRKFTPPHSPIYPFVRYK